MIHRHHILVLLGDIGRVVELHTISLHGRIPEHKLILAEADKVDGILQLPIGHILLAQKIGSIGGGGAVGEVFVWLKPQHRAILKLTRHIEARQSMLTHPLLGTLKHLPILLHPILLLQALQILKQRVQHSLHPIHRLARKEIHLYGERAIVSLQSGVGVSDIYGAVVVLLVLRHIVEVKKGIGGGECLHSHRLALVAGSTRCDIVAVVGGREERQRLTLGATLGNEKACRILGYEQSILPQFGAELRQKHLK